jgi:isoaspartyl peptidase/L-asparaginase-like protein (Ntn-hydrolase superfamily)
MIMIKGVMISTWKMSFDGLTAGAALLAENQPVHKAILTAVKNVEDNQNYVSVGYGGLPNLDGEVELDAAYMDGDTLGFGGVISVKDIKNPIEVAYDLSHYKRNCLLAGEGAMAYARQNGYELKNMLSEQSRSRYEESDKQVNAELLEAYGGHDTVCVIGKDQRGSMACGVSTSGLFLKRPGRVGDTPIIGSGLYADSEIGCAAATGVGEDIMKGCLSYSITGLMHQGVDVQTACVTTLDNHLNRLTRCGHNAGSISVIAMDQQGHIGAATNKAAFPFVVADENHVCHIYVAANEGGKNNIFRPNDIWLKNYTGD